MIKRAAYLILAGIGGVLLGCGARYAILHDSFHLLEACHRLLVDRPQKHPPRSIWRNSRNEPVPLSFALPDRDMFFAEYHGSDSFLMALRTHGIYQTVVRMHVGSMAWDRGTWRLTDSGDILLRSDRRFHDLTSDEHWYVMVSDLILADLPALRAGIEDFLARNPADVFSFAEVEAIRSYPAAYDPRETFSAFTGYSWETVQRDSLEHFLTQMDDYLAWSEKNVFHLRPITYRSYVFLMDLDSRLYAPEMQLSKMKHEVDALRGNNVPTFMYVAVTDRIFETETEETVPLNLLGRGLGWFR